MNHPVHHEIVNNRLFPFLFSPSHVDYSVLAFSACRGPRRATRKSFPLTLTDSYRDATTFASAERT
jgi:hypothetical protein